MNKKTRIATAVAAAAVALASGAAQAARIDPFGFGGAGGSYEVGNLGWNNGNAISTPISIASGGGVQNTAVGDTIQTYGQAKLQGLNDVDNNTIVVAGFNPNTWSYVFGFSEEVVAATDVAATSSRTFRTTTVAGQANFFQIWAGGAPAVDLTGKGFNGDGGGTLLISGTIADYDPLTGIGQTSFNSSSALLGDLDQFGTPVATRNDYAGYKSISGTGGGKITAVIDSVNDMYFLDGISLLTLDFITDTFQNLPFLQVNPSSCFWDGTAYFEGAGNGIPGGCGTAGDGGTIGLINGVQTAADATNTMFQTRATTVLPTGLPEPGSLVLLAAGLFGLAAARRKSADR